MGSHPEWAEDLRRRYKRGETTQFILHGNTLDLVEWDGELLSFDQYLADKLLAGKSVVVVYNLATGARIVKRPSRTSSAADGAALLNAGFDELITKTDRAKFLAAMERILRTCKDVGLVIEYAETVAPAADPALMIDDDRTALVTLHRWSLLSEIDANDNIVLLVTENLSELSPKLVSNPKIATVPVPMPDEAARRRVVQLALPKDEEAYRQKLASITAGLKAVQIWSMLRPAPEGATDESEEERFRFIKQLLGSQPGAEERARKFAQMTQGMTEDAIRDLVAPGVQHTRDNTAERDEIDRLIAKRKREIIERECYGLIEFVEPKHDFRVVGGIEGVKTELSRVARAIREGNTARVPMGLLFTGPMGAGKTFVAEAFAKESGLTTIKLKNFRSKWVGATEGNLERILNVIQAIGQVLVIIDEGDRAFGNQSDGDGDGGTGSRVIGRLKEFMSDTANRGRILFILMTNRPDKLDVDIKRAGRLDRKIPLLYPQAPEEIEAVLGAQLRKQRLKSDWAFPADRDAISAKLVGLSNADVEAILLLAAEYESGPEAKAVEQVSKANLVQAMGDYLPSRDTRMLEYMELLAVFEASNRQMLPKKYQTMSADELQARLDLLRLEIGNRR